MALPAGIMPAIFTICIGNTTCHTSVPGKVSMILPKRTAESYVRRKIHPRIGTGIEIMQFPSDAYGQRHCKVRRGYGPRKKPSIQHDFPHPEKRFAVMSQGPVIPMGAENTLKVVLQPWSASFSTTSRTSSILLFVKV